MKKTLFFLEICIFLFILSINVSAICGTQTITVQPSACNGEYVDILVSGRYFMDTDEAVWCAANFRNVLIDLYLYEDDWSSADDLIDHIGGFFQAVESPIFCQYVDYSYTFNAKLSDFAGGVEGNTIEIFGFFDIHNGPYDGECSTSTENVDIISGQCGDGVCCDLSTCNFRLSSYKCADNVQTDYGCPWGTSPGDDVGVQYADRYCSGSSSSCSGSLQWDSWTVQDNCNSNEMCIDDNPACQSVECDSNPDCGADGWINSPYCSGDDVYQTYREWTCHNPSSPSSYCSYSDDDVLKESCNECSGGACVIECNLDSDCGTGGWWLNNKYCNSGDVWNTWREDKCYNPGTLSSFCGYIDDDRFYTACPNGCSSGSCIIECSSASDCGTDGFIGNEYCSLGDVWDTNRTYDCTDPGTKYSLCGYSDSNQLKESCPNTCLNGNCTTIACYNSNDCGTDGFIGNEYCNLGDVWDIYRTWTCNNPGTASASCTNSDVNQSKEICTFGCTDGYCQTPICDRDSDCGADGWLGNNYCNSSDVWDEYIEHTCNDPGTLNASCTNITENKFKTFCVNGCNSGSCVLPCSIYEDFEGAGTPAGFNVWANNPDFDSTDYAKSGSQSLKMNKGIIDYLKANITNPYFLEAWVMIDIINGVTISNVILTDNAESIMGYAHHNGSGELYHRIDFTNDVQGSTDILAYEDIWYRFKLLIDPINNLGSAFIYDESDNLVVEITERNINDYDGGDELWGDQTENFNYYIDDFHVCNTACINVSHCGTDQWIGSTFCVNDEVWQKRREWTCNHGSTIDAYCSYTEEDQLKQICPEICDQGSCTSPVCYTDSDCGTDGWVGANVCNSNNEWNTWREYTCNNPGTNSSSCTFNEESQIRRVCSNGCSDIDGFCNDTYLWITRFFFDGTIYRLKSDYTLVQSFEVEYQPSGLAWDGEYLWELDSTNCKIYKLNTNRTIIDNINAPGCAAFVWPQDLTFDGEYLWQSSSNNNIYKLTKNGTVIDSFSAPGPKIRGLAWDGEYLWSADSQDDKIYKLTTSGTVVDSFNSPGTKPIGLSFYNNLLWNIDFDDELVYKISTNGTIVGNFSTPSDWPSGIVWQLLESECNLDSECGIDGFIGTEYCNGKQIEQIYRTYTCSNPGTEISSCSYSDSPQLKQDCGTDEWINSSFCSVDDVWQTFRTYACEDNASGAYCSFSDSDQLIENCADTCLNGSCTTIECYLDSDCGIDGVVGSDYCSGNDIQQDYINYTCINPGIPSALCNSSNSSQLIQTCENGCTQGRCINCIEVCNFGMCYEYCDG